MYNDYNIPLSQVISYRFDAFRTIKSDSLPYVIIQNIWRIVFFIPFCVESFVEFTVTTVLGFIGHLCEKLLSILWIIPGAIYGLAYTLIKWLFYLLFIICILPNFIIDANRKGNYT